MAPNLCPFALWHIIASYNESQVKGLHAEDGYAESRFGESRDPRGKLTDTSAHLRREIIGDKCVYDIERDATVKIKDL